MKKTVENIDDYIKNGGELSQETLEALLENKYIEVNVVDVKNHKVYKNSVGKLPSFVRQIQSQPPPHGLQKNLIWTTKLIFFLEGMVKNLYYWKKKSILKKTAI